MFWFHLVTCLHPASPSPPPLYPEPVAKSEKEEEEGEKGRERERLSRFGASFPASSLNLQR